VNGQIGMFVEAIADTVGIADGCLSDSLEYFLHDGRRMLVDGTVCVAQRLRAGFHIGGGIELHSNEEVPLACTFCRLYS